jgi:uncharacterized delta-60 repeat protein
MRRWLVVFFGIGALLFPTLLAAARGDLDTTFGSGGKVTTDFGGNEMAWGLAVQPDGKAVLAGGRSDSGPPDDFVLARYSVNGALDATFDGDGKVTTDFGGRSDRAGDVAIQADGKILAAGSGFPAEVRPLDFALARYNRDGTLDSTFGDGGKVLTTFEPNSIESANAVVIQPDGKIVAAGGTQSAGAPRADLAVARYLPNGSLDPSFDGDGLVVTPISPGHDTVFDLVVQPDGKLIAAGWSNPGGFDIAMARYNADGSLDSSFDRDGTVIAPFRPASTYASHVVVQPDGKILTGGKGLARFDPDGSVDPSFGAGGRAVTDLGLLKPVLQPDGKILAAGSIFQSSGQFSDFVVVRLTAAGRIDSTFGRAGRVVTNFRPQDDATDAELLGNGKLVVAGYTSQVPFEAPADFAVARYVAIRFCIVPNVRGKTLGDARAGLTKALCKVGTVKRTYSASVRKGRVISQRPAPRTRMAELAKVNLVVSRGRKNVGR